MPKKAGEYVLADDDVRKLVMARLSVLSPDMVISMGSAGTFTRERNCQALLDRI